MEESKQIKKDFIWQRLSECPLGDMQLRRVRLRRNSIKCYVIPWPNNPSTIELIP